MVSYVYDAYGNLSELVYPDNTKVTYTYDLCGNIKTVTDFDGNFELTVPAGVKHLIISSIGFKTVTVAVKPTIKVKLESEKIIYSSKDYKTQKPIVVFIFNKEESKPIFDIWCNK